MADTDTEQRPSKLSDKDLLLRIRKRFPLMEEADHDNRACALEDMKFLHKPGYQWDTKVKKARGSRPCYEFNKARIKAKRVVNEMRANRPAGKVRAVEESDRKTAEIIEGIGRNILSVCDFDTTSDYAGEYQVGAGMGAWRIVTEYAEDSFDQDILLKPVPNPFNLYWGPESVDPMHRDSPDWALLDRMSKSAFDEKYPKARRVNFDSDTGFDDDEDWFSEAEGVRVCEYHWKEPYEKQLIQLKDGRVLDADSPDGKLIDPALIRRRRTAQCHRILMCVASGDAILEGPVEMKGRYHRFFVVHGEWIIIDGKPQWCGLTRYAKDAQRKYNVAATSVTEAIATAPNSHFWATAEQAKGNTDAWNRAIAENLPYLIYNADVKAQGPPARMGGADVPVALIQEQQIADQELKDVMGVYDASLGDRSNETSGRAITRRNEQGQIVNFNFPDNMAKAKQHTVTVINDLIPFYYDTERTVRVIGMDGAEDYVRINTAGVDSQTGEPVLVNDLTRGKYDVTVTVGPSFATQRQEAAETFTQMAAQDPALMPTAGDLVYQAMDLPYAEQIAERRRAMLPPQIQALVNKDKRQPPEVAQAMAQIEAIKAQLDEQGQLIQQAAADAEKAKGEAGKAISDLNVKRAQFDADVARSLAQLAEKEAALILEQAKFTAGTTNAQTDQAREQLNLEIQNAMSQVQQMAAEYLQQATTAFAQLSAMPKRRIARVRRENGELVGEIVEAPEEAAPA
jgi:hypothetical protein